MFTTEEDAYSYLREWLERETFFNDIVCASASTGERNGRPCWIFQMLRPEGTFIVYNDNGDVEDLNESKAGNS